MTNPFRDQEKFMRASDQTVGELNQEQFNMYVKLIDEEVKELIAKGVQASCACEAVGISQDVYYRRRRMEENGTDRPKKPPIPRKPRATGKYVNATSKRMIEFKKLQLPPVQGQ